MQKQELRKHIQELRNALPEPERTAKNRAILQNLLIIPEVLAARTILLYLGFKNEVETEPLFRWGWQQGKIMAAPATISRERKLIPVALDSFDELHISSFGVREPRLTEGVPVESIDVVVLPGIAFDKQGYRIGYGGGYYDRFLPLLSPHTLTIGVAYQLQFLDHVPTEEHDVPLDMIVTEKQIWDCKASMDKDGLQ